MSSPPFVRAACAVKFEFCKLHQLLFTFVESAVKDLCVVVFFLLFYLYLFHPDPSLHYKGQVIPSRFNGCHRKHREGKGAATRGKPSRRRDPASDQQRQGVRPKMAGVKFVFNARLSSRDGVEHVGPHPKLCQACFRLHIDRHCYFSHLGTCGLRPLAPVCVADGQERLVRVFLRCLGK